MCSRGLKNYEKEYTTTELELLAIVFEQKNLDNIFWVFLPHYLQTTKR